MRQGRTAKTLLRAAFAALFGFVSLAHGPVMTFAQAQAAPMHRHDPAPAPAASHHHHHADTVADRQALPPLPDTICHALACFTSLGSPAVASPDWVRVPLGQLFPAVARVLTPATADPADPPPRLPA
jgi:hypothetical protein